MCRQTRLPLPPVRPLDHGPKLGQRHRSRRLLIGRPPPDGVIQVLGEGTPYSVLRPPSSVAVLRRRVAVFIRSVVDTAAGAPRRPSPVDHDRQRLGCRLPVLLRLRRSSQRRTTAGEVRRFAPDTPNQQPHHRAGTRTSNSPKPAVLGGGHPITTHIAPRSRTTSQRHGHLHGFAEKRYLQRRGICRIPMRAARGIGQAFVEPPQRITVAPVRIGPSASTRAAVMALSAIPPGPALYSFQPPRRSVSCGISRPSRG